MKNRNIETFVKRAFKHHAPKDVSVDQLIEMLEEKVEDLQEEGYSESEAVDKTIAEFGDANDYYAPHIEREKRRHKRRKTLAHYKNSFLFASLGTLLIIVILLFINFVLLRDTEYLSLPWSPVLALGVLFWPLSLLYKFLNRKGDLS